MMHSTKFILWFQSILFHSTRGLSPSVKDAGWNRHGIGLVDAPMRMAAFPGFGD
jgi:hypothetical protein